MLKYFIEGGPLFMGMLSVVFLIILVLAVIALRKKDPAAQAAKLANIKSLGLFALVLGMLGQFLGLFQAFDIIGQGIEVSPRIFANGLKISSISSIYGMIIFLVSYLISFLLPAISGQPGE